jgi:hypothetical protein
MNLFSWIHKFEHPMIRIYLKQMMLYFLFPPSRGGSASSLHWMDMHLTIETNCGEPGELIKESTLNTPVYTFKDNVIQDLLGEREISIGGRLMW